VTGGTSRFAKSAPAEPIRLGRALSVKLMRFVNRTCGLFVFTVTTCLCLLASAGDHAPSATIVLVPPNSPQAVVEVRGLSASLQAELARLPRDDSRRPQIFGVSVSGATHLSIPDNQPAMLGTYEVTPNVVRFKPRFPLERGIEYRAVFNSPASSASENRLRLEAKFVIPVAGAHPATGVVAIYPSGAALPENLLRFYLQFSAPMSQGKSYDYVRLHDENGSEIERPFLELPQELWSPDGRRLTLLFEPGRVKRGLVPRAEQGPILVAGHTYTLTIDGNWPDADGHPLQETAHRTFRALPPEMSQPNPQKWMIESPPAESRDPLAVRFPRALDHAMLEHVLTVVRFDATQDRVKTPNELAGQVKVSDEETRWCFEPRQPWRAGRYALVVPTTLEDRAGNSIRLPFEVDLNHPRAEKPAAANVEIEFTVRGKR
jgi:hypothetical protein